MCSLQVNPFFSHRDELSSLDSCLCWLAERTRIRDELGGGSGLDGEDQANGMDKPAAEGAPTKVSLSVLGLLLLLVAGWLSKKITDL